MSKFHIRLMDPLSVSENHCVFFVNLFRGQKFSKYAITTAGEEVYHP